MLPKEKKYGKFLTRVIYFLLWMVMTIQLVRAQTPIIDTYKAELEKDIHDSTRVYYLLVLYEETFESDPLEAENYLQQAIKLSRQIPDKFHYLQAGLAQSRLLIYNEVPLDSTVALLMDLLDLARDMDDERGQADVFFELGEAYQFANQDEKAFLYYKEGLEIYQRLDEPENIVWYLNPMGVILHEKGDKDEAFYYYKEGVELAISVNDSSWVTMFYNNMAEVHRESMEFEEAILYYARGLETSNNPWDSCLIYTNLGMMYTNVENFSKASDHLERARILGLKYEIKEELCNVFLRWGDFYAAQGLHEKAFEEFDIAEMLINQYETDLSVDYTEYFWIELYKSRAKAYEEFGDPAKALAYHKKYKLIEDTLYGEEKRKLILNLDAGYRIGQKEIENQLLKTTSSGYKTEIQRKTFTILAVVLIALLFLALTYMLYISNRRSKQYAKELEAEVEASTRDVRLTNLKLENSNAELQSFASITSHDLKEPLRTIAGFTSFLEQNINNKQYENLATPVGFIKTNVARMFRLIEDILAYSSLTENAEKELISFNEIKEHVRESLRTMIEEKDAEIIYGTGLAKAEPLMLPSRLKVVFKNLIENGIKYNTNEKPQVVISYSAQGGKHVFLFADNGIGIAPEYRETIFEMFKRLHTRDEYRGTGVGLAICKKTIQNLGGKLYLNRSDENGSEFYLEIS
ncbi:MAG: hypothetical protein DWQ02_10635 [Bacteroidetes bacterium]|nr:MAG: hypothetical protein DWQ02_10635 [Bacteroidota bacterium]